MEREGGSDLPGEAAPRLRLDDLLLQLVDRAQETLQTQERLRGLLQANQAVVENLDLATVLRRIVESACVLVGSQYGALGVVAPDGSGLEQFIYVGMTEADVRRIGRLPQGKGLLGALIDDPYPIRLDNFADDVRSVGFPEGHPPMNSFLGVPIRVRDEVFGNLYLADASSGHFDDEDQVLVTALAATAGVAIQNARLFEQSRRRQEWLQASAEVTRQLLTITDPESLQLLADTTRQIAGADSVTLVTPDDSGTQLCVAAKAGDHAVPRLGQLLPSGSGELGDLLGSANATLLRHAPFGYAEDPRLPDALVSGHAMLLPLPGADGVRGVLICDRGPDRPAFTEDDLDMAATFAGRAALALELAEARRDQQRMAMLEDRARIARDLHDHVIQQLFAAGMTLQGISVAVADPLRASMLDKVVDTLDEAVRQIRTSIFQLRPHDYSGSSLRTAVLTVVAEVAPALGFEPRVSFDGPVDAVSDDALAEDVLAVVREGLSNVAKHAQAGTAEVRVHASASHLDVTVEDDGIGVGTLRRSSGLTNLQQRAEHRGGRFALEPVGTGQGTSLNVSVPLG